MAQMAQEIASVTSVLQKCDSKIVQNCEFKIPVGYPEHSPDRINERPGLAFSVENILDPNKFTGNKNNNMIFAKNHLFDAPHHWLLPGTHHPLMNPLTDLHSTSLESTTEEESVYDLESGN